MALSFLTWIKVGETISDIWYYQLFCMLFLKYVVDQTCCATWFWFLFVCYWDNSDSQGTWMNRVFFFCFIEDGSIFTSKVAFIVRNCSSFWSGVNNSLCFHYESCGLWSGSKMKWLDNMYVVYSCLGPHCCLILEVSFS